jgi:hypothetical protein
LSSLFVGLFLFLSLRVTVAFALLRSFVVDRGVRRRRRQRRRRHVRSAVRWPGVTTLGLALVEVPLEGDHLLQSSLHLLRHPPLDPVQAALPPITTAAARARCCCWHLIEVLLRVAVLRLLLGLGHHSFFLFVVVVVVLFVILVAIAVVFVCCGEVEVHPLDDVALPRGKRYVQRRHTAGGPSREQELFDRVR